MDIRKTFGLITLLQNKHATYEELVEFLFKTKPPSGHKFLELIDLSCIVENFQSPSYDEVVKLEENPNPPATIAFIICFPFQYYIFKNIYRHLPESEFIIDLQYMKSNNEQWYQDIGRLLRFLRNNKVHYRILFDYYSEPERFFKKYEVLVSFFSIESLTLSCNAEKKKVRVMYGHSKDLYNFGAWSRHFDLALTYGPHSNKMMSIFTRAEIVGNARFDDWFSGSITKDKVSYLQKELRPEKKTILYMPTHSNLSSLEFMSPAFLKLGDKYNVIIKPHPVTFAFEKKRLEEFKKVLSYLDIFWADDFHDIIHLLYVSDAVLSDNSGAIFDAVLADKPLVLIDNLKKEELQPQAWHKIVKRISTDFWISPKSHPGSIEQRIKEDPALKPGTVLKDHREVETAIQFALEDPDKSFCKAREKLRAMLFSNCDGSSGKRSAELIRGIKSEKNKEAFEILALRAEDMMQQKIINHHFQSLQSITSNYCNLLPYYQHLRGVDEIIFSVVIPTYNGGDRILRLLQSLAVQSGLEKERYEMIVVDDCSADNTKKLVLAWMQSNLDLRFRYVRLSKNRGPAYARNVGIKLARGTFVAFTDDDCIVPRNWLKLFLDVFHKHREIAGVGGWYKTEAGDARTIFDLFFDWTRSRAIAEYAKATWLNSLRGFGNTANMCVRKKILENIGGFNIFFTHPAFEDFELRDRLLYHKFALLAHPHQVTHTKHLSLVAFMRRSMLMGWGRFLLYKIHKTTPIGYRTTFSVSLFNILIEWWLIVFNYPHRLPRVGVFKTMIFFALHIVFEISALFGKYLIPLEIISRVDLSTAEFFPKSTAKISQQKMP